MFRPRHAIAAFSSLCLVGLTSAACDDDTAATPQVILTDAYLQGSTITNCTDRRPLFQIGDIGNPAANPPIPARPVKDGESWEQGSVALSCAVKPVGGNEFNVEAAVTLSGATGGLFQLNGRFRTDGQQNGIYAKVSSRFTTNTYEQLDRNCIVQYTTPFQGVAAGRVWGVLTCPKAENVAAQTSCEVVAEFRFENCAKE